MNNTVSAHSKRVGTHWRIQKGGYIYSHLGPFSFFFDAVVATFLDPPLVADVAS